MAIQAKSNRVRGIIDGLQRESPKLYQALIAMTDDINAIHAELHPIIAALAPFVEASEFPPAAPTGMAYGFGPFTVNFTWNYVNGAFFYELRSGGTDWDSAVFVVKTPSHGCSIPALLEGSHVYRLKSINAAGLYSELEDTVTVVVTETAAPVVTVQVIDNNVLLWWTVPVSIFQIDHYDIYHDDGLGGAQVKFAQLTGTFISRYETVAGTYIYQVVAVDCAGNVGTIGQISATVRQPVDFTVIANREIDLDGAGVTLSNMLYIPDLLLGCLDLPETYEDHFLTPAWGGVAASPQDQINAGYAVYVQEGLLTGYIIDEYDYTGGGDLSNIIITIDYTKKIADPSCEDATITVEMAYKVDGGAWSGYTAGSSQYFESFRYLRVKLTITPINADSLITLEDIQVILNVKTEMDSNSKICLATDAGGTLVSMPGAGLGDGSKTFKDIQSITLTSLSVEPITCIFDFVDAPNPTHFHIYCFDASGRRIDAVVGWKVRGIT